MNLEATLDAAYDQFSDLPIVEDYMDRHGVESAGILTVTDDERAALVCDYLAERIAGKTVVEIGGGIGLLAMHLSSVAKRVFVIEACPVWTSVAVLYFFNRKPKNVSFLFGAADEFAGHIHGEVALFCTHSAHKKMAMEASKFAPVVIDVYQELVPIG